VETRPFFSVVVPTFQRRSAVVEAIESVLGQLFRDFELILVDNGSADRTADALKEYGNRIRYLWQAHLGPSAARNTGLKQARGEVVAFLDSDHLWLPEHLAVVAAVLHDYPEAVLASTLPTSPSKPTSNPAAAPLVEALPRSFLRNYGASPSTVAVRRGAVLAVGGFDERLRLAEDADLWLRIALRGDPFVHVPRRTVTTRVQNCSRLLSRQRAEYAASLEASTTRAIRQLDGGSTQYADALRGRLHLVRALRALDGGDARAVRRELEVASGFLPDLLSDPPGLLTDARFILAEGDGLGEYGRRLALLWRAWPADRAALGRVLRTQVISGVRAWDGRSQRAAAEWLRLIMIRTERGPLRVVWWLAYEALARAVARYVRRGDNSVSVYLRGSVGTRDAVYGLSDVDLTFVSAAGDAGRRAIARRALRLRQRLPAPVRGLVHHTEVSDEQELRTTRASSPFTHGLRSSAPAATSRERRRQRARFGRPVPGLAKEWRLIAGPERRSEYGPPDPAERRLTAWLELQYWWLWGFRMCAEPGPFDAPYKCVKLMTEPARIWLWLASGEQFTDRRALIARAASALPAEAETLEMARHLLNSLDRSPEAPLERALESCVRVSQELERLIAADVASAGTTVVRLPWGGPEEMVVSRDAVAGCQRAVAPHGMGTTLPLVDWRARVWSLPPDECFSCCDAEGPDPGLLGSAAIASNNGAFAALRLGHLLLLPSTTQARLRALHSAASDPVSFALMESAEHAHFPNVPGWSARDSGLRATSEHLGWLRLQSNQDPVEELGRLFTAARASLFLQSVESGDPELPLTVAATAQRLADAGEGQAALAEESVAAYRVGRLERKPPRDELVASLRALVEGLPTYEGRV
jgi:glycosyltransferase involved in cell wall biosynthesis